MSTVSGNIQEIDYNEILLQSVAVLPWSQRAFEEDVESSKRLEENKKND